MQNHPWSLFARGVGHHDEHDETMRRGMLDHSSEDENPAASGESNTFADTLGGHLANAGAPEWLIRQVEAVVMYHHYQVEARIEVITESVDEQARNYLELGKRLSRLEDKRMEAASVASEVEGHSTMLKDFRRDFEDQMSRHDDHFMSFAHALHQSSVELAALRADFSLLQLSSSSRVCDDRAMTVERYSEGGARTTISANCLADAAMEVSVIDADSPHVSLEDRIAIKGEMPQDFQNGSDHDVTVHLQLVKGALCQPHSGCTMFDRLVEFDAEPNCGAKKLSGSVYELSAIDASSQHVALEDLTPRREDAPDVLSDFPCPDIGNNQNGYEFDSIATSPRPVEVAIPEPTSPASPKVERLHDVGAGTTAGGNKTTDVAIGVPLIGAQPQQVTLAG